MNQQRPPAPGAETIAPFSPASRPSPPGGLRPALTPAAGGTGPHLPGTGHEGRSTIQDPPNRGLHGLGGLPIAHDGVVLWTAGDPDRLYALEWFGSEDDGPEEFPPASRLRVTPAG
jgi:hypothetical protein